MSASDAPPADFLTRLAARALGLTNPVEPRLPSVFEGPTDGAVLPASDPAPPGLARRAEPVQGRESQPVPGHERPGSGKRDGDADRSHSPTASVNNGGFAVQAANVPDRVGSPDAAQVALPAPTRVPPAPPLPATHPDRPWDGAPHTSGDAALVTAALVGTGSAPRDPLQVTGVLQVAETSRRRAPHAVVDEPAPQPLSGSPAHGALVPRRLPVPAACTVPAAPGNTGTPSRPVQEPVVQVSIGRVEVRASQVVPARPAAQGGSPKPLSLDEYLKQQERQR